MDSDKSVQLKSESKTNKDAIKDTIDKKILFVYKRMDEMSRKLQKHDEILKNTCPNAYNYAFNDYSGRQLQFPEQLGAHAESININTNAHKRIISEFEAVSRDLTKTVSSDVHSSENKIDQTISTPFVTLQQQQNLQHLSETQVSGFPETINNHPPIVVGLPDQQNNDQIIHAEKPVEIATLSNDNLTTGTSETCDELDIAKYEEHKQKERKRRYYKNKYNYLKTVRPSYPNSINNATINVHVDYDFGERVIIPVDNFKILKKPIRFNDHLRVRLRRCDD